MFEAGHARRIDDPLAIAARLSPAESPIVGTPDDDHLTGTDDADVFDVSQGGSDTVDAFGGDDLIQFGGAFEALDRVDGGAGVDVVELTGTYDLTVTGAMLKNVEELRLGTGGDYRLTLAADLVAAGAALSITSSSGVTQVDGSAAAGDLLFYAGDGDDRLIGGTGDDVFYVSTGGHDTFKGGSGFDRVDLSALTDGVIIDLGSRHKQQVGGSSLALSGVEAVWGTQGSDAIEGSQFGDWIVGHGGNDQLYGEGGSDLIEVGVFDGVFTANGLINGGRGGQDVVSFAALGGSTGAVHVQLGVAGLQDTGQGTFRITDVEGISGTTFNDTLTGSNNSNLLLGGDGADLLIGKGGVDILWGDAVYGVDGAGPPKIYEPLEAGGADILDGGDGGDVLVGGGGADVLLGGADIDELQGGTGDDLLTGGTAADLLTGGAGADRFVYTAVADSSSNAADTITDFAPGDLIDLLAVDADPVMPGDQAFHFGATRDHVGDIVVSYDFRHNLTVVDLFLNNDRIADMTINLTGNVTLSAADFVL